MAWGTASDPNFYQCTSSKFYTWDQRESVSPSLVMGLPMAMMSTPWKMSLYRKREGETNTLKKQGQDLDTVLAVVRSQILVVPAALTGSG